MSDEDKNKMGGDGQKKPPGNFQFPASTWLVWIPNPRVFAAAADSNRATSRGSTSIRRWSSAVALARRVDTAPPLQVCLTAQGRM